MTSTRFLATSLSLLALLAAGCGTNPAVRPMLTGTQAPLARLHARAVPGNYYAAADGKQGQALLLSLHQIVVNHKDLGYDGARDAMFADVDDLDNDNTVECIYTGRDQANVSSRQTAYAGGAGLNAEHTWPQTLGAEGVAKDDLHHLFPADIKANGIRSSYPFGAVQSASWTGGGSKLGTNAAGVTVFEPRDAHKGDTARAIFYFYMAYGVAGGHVDTRNFRVEEETLKRWNEQDPVDASEAARNDAIFGVQGNRNPFVDHPEWVNAVGEFMADAKLAKTR